MDFENSSRVNTLLANLTKFMDEAVYPNEETYYRQLTESGDRWSIPPIMEEMKALAWKAGLWNFLLPESEYGAGLTNLDYAPLCQVMGRSAVAPEVFNCNAPDTGNMEVLVRYGTDQQKNHSWPGASGLVFL